MSVLTYQNILLFLSVLLSGMIAGLLYGYDCSVNLGLGNLSDEEYLNAFQSINKSILNPYFFSSFFGTLIVLALATWANYTSKLYVSFYFLLSAVLVYTIGVIGVTILGNVPLNETLAGFDIKHASNLEIAKQRELFEKPWNNYHFIRTISSLICFSLAIISIITYKK